MSGKGKMQVFCKIPFSGVGMQNRNFSCGSILVVGFFSCIFQCHDRSCYKDRDKSSQERDYSSFLKSWSGIREQERFFCGEEELRSSYR